MTPAAFLAVGAAAQEKYQRKIARIEASHQRKVDAAEHALLSRLRKLDTERVAARARAGHELRAAEDAACEALHQAGHTYDEVRALRGY